MGLSLTGIITRLRRSSAGRSPRDSMRAKNKVRRSSPGLEALEIRDLLSTGLWSGYGGNGQHTALSTVASQPLEAIRWQTPVDLQPQYQGSDLLIHYGEPMVTGANTVLVPVKTGPT